MVSGTGMLLVMVLLALGAVVAVGATAFAVYLAVRPKRPPRRG